MGWWLHCIQSSHGNRKRTRRERWHKWVENTKLQSDQAKPFHHRRYNGLIMWKLNLSDIVVIGIKNIWIFLHGWWTVNFRLTSSSLYLVGLKNLAHFEMVKNLLKTFYIKVYKKAQLTVSVNYLLCAYSPPIKCRGTSFQGTPSGTRQVSPE